MKMTTLIRVRRTPDGDWILSVYEGNEEVFTRRRSEFPVIAVNTDGIRRLNVTNPGGGRRFHGDRGGGRRELRAATTLRHSATCAMADRPTGCAARPQAVAGTRGKSGTRHAQAYGNGVRNSQRQSTRRAA